MISAFAFASGANGILFQGFRKPKMLVAKAFREGIARYQELVI